MSEPVDLSSVAAGTILVDDYAYDVRYLVVRGPMALCAYVGVPVDHPLAFVDYSSLPLQCHGGLTFSGEGSTSLPSGWYWFGWDYGHPGDKPFYDLYFIGSMDLHEWRVDEVNAEAGTVAWRFRLLCDLAERISRRLPIQGLPESS